MSLHKYREMALNHFVPLVIRSQHLSVLKLNPFFHLSWAGKINVGEVLEQAELLERVCICFLVAEKKHEMYMFCRPEVPDVSWEPVSSVEHEVKLCLIKCFTNQRTQHYRVLHHAS